MLAFQVQDKYPLYLELAQITEDKLGVERIEILKTTALNLEFRDITNIYDLALSLIKQWSINSQKLHQLRFEELKKVGGSSQKSGELPKNATLTISDLEDSLSKKVGSSAEKSGGFLSNNSEGLLKKKSRVIVSSLLLCLIPVKIRRYGIYSSRARALKLKQNPKMVICIEPKETSPERLKRLTGFLNR